MGLLFQVSKDYHHDNGFCEKRKTISSQEYRILITSNGPLHDDKK